MKRHQGYFFILLVLSFGFEFEALAAKKDFKGLFGSYRREKFTENEGNRNDFGFDLLLSTLLPITSVAKSAQDSSLTFSPLNYSTFFNVEASLWFSLGYHWAIYANVGKYSYESRKQNDKPIDPKTPVFHHFELDATPAIAGVRYRLSQDDIVPYISLGIGMAYVHRKGFTEGAAIVTNGNSSIYSEEENKTVACGHGAAGIEFFFAPKAGLRVEASAYYMNLPERTIDPGGSPENRPKIQFQSNVWSLRYASGIFFLF
ncbi:MAG: hypothetical protein HQ462_09085 [Deltaproteobacteria bacterium]|nr:hypothetical protein [Deltaproteobacteria bacterium]